MGKSQHFLAVIAEVNEAYTEYAVGPSGQYFNEFLFAMWTDWCLILGFDDFDHALLSSLVDSWVNM
jgi:hypothetical protein